jgi:hypothetical protein
MDKFWLNAIPAFIVLLTIAVAVRFLVDAYR